MIVISDSSQKRLLSVSLACRIGGTAKTHHCRLPSVKMHDAAAVHAGWLMRVSQTFRKLHKLPSTEKTEILLLAGGTESEPVHGRSPACRTCRLPMRILMTDPSVFITRIVRFLLRKHGGFSGTHLSYPRYCGSAHEAMQYNTRTSHTAC